MRLEVERQTWPSKSLARTRTWCSIGRKTRSVVSVRMGDFGRVSSERARHGDASIWPVSARWMHRCGRTFSLLWPDHSTGTHHRGGEFRQNSRSPAQPCPGSIPSSNSPPASSKRERYGSSCVYSMTGALWLHDVCFFDADTVDVCRSSRNGALGPGRRPPYSPPRAAVAKAALPSTADGSAF